MRELRTSKFEEAVLDRVAENPSVSTREIAREMEVSQTSVFRVLKEQLLHPFQLQKVQHLIPGEYPRRVEYCNVMQEKIRNDNDFLMICFTFVKC